MAPPMTDSSLILGYLAGASGLLGGRPQAVAATPGPEGPTEFTDLGLACA